MILNRSLAVLVCAVAFIAGATPGYAADAWRVVQMVGAVKVGSEGVTPVAVTNDQTLPNGAWLETAPGARAILVRGTETIAVAPASRVQLPLEKINGNTQVLQSLGSVLYQIGKEKAPHFQVETPYLAAVVKGTTFTVTVKNGEASVDVTEGLVQVATPDFTDTQYVGAGFSATVHEGLNSVTVDRTAVGLAPAKADEPKPVTPTVVIEHPIGDVVIDVNEVSGGLAGTVVEPIKETGGVVASALNPNAGDNGNGNSNAGGNGNGLALGASVDVATPGLGAGLALGAGNDTGNGDGLALGADNGLGLGSGNDNSSGNGNSSGSGLGLGLGPDSGNGNGNGNGLGLGLGNGNGNGLGLGLAKGKNNGS